MSPLHTLLEPKQLLTVRGVAYAMIDTGSKFMPLPSVHAHGTNRQSCPGRILFVHELCLYVACTDHAY